MTAREQREYPAALAAAEQAWIATRRAAINAEAGDDPAKAIPDGAPAVGLALSGGGIRSATFSLGVIQAFVKLGLLRRVDFLSTVSGGGYIGGFLGRLYSRHYATPSVVEHLLHPERRAQTRPPWSSQVAADDETRANLDRLRPFDWLRDNGRYLAPNGTGDLMLALAVAIRNWVALQIVFASFLLVPLLSAQLLRRLFEKSGIGAALSMMPASVSERLDAAGRGLLDWSPFINLVPLLLMLAVFPLGWAFWLIEQRRRMEPHPELGVGLLIAISVGALQLARPPLHFNWWQPLFWVLIGSSLLALAVAQLARGVAKSNVISSYDLDGDRITHARNLVTGWLSIAVATTLGLLAFSIVDTLGQTFYEHLGDDRGGAMGWTAALIAAAAPFAVRLTRLPSLLSSLGGAKGKAAGLKLPVEWLAALAALLLALIVLVGLDAFAHAMADGFVRSDEAPRHFWLPLAAFGLLLVFAALFGWTWPFLNLSSQSSLYRARLARAYLGASNWRRFRRTRDASVTDTIAGDDIRAADYWTKVVNHGGPLHLINVTINETAGDDAKTVLRDRKGIALAAGPCGYSAGARHHALRVGELAAMSRAADAPLSGPRRRPTSERREPVYALRAGTGYSMFYRRTQVAAEDAVTMAPKDAGREATCLAGLEQVEKLSLGQWIAISGAAFTTGLGSRTTIGLSFLLGFANVRLGYWWDAGDRMDAPRGLRATLGRLLRTAFPIQCYLLDEFTATFRGPGVRRWYLSDGGHFENMGAYELIRRRLPMIVIVDGEEDSDYSYEGLGNFVRKARLDFDAEIEFLDDAALKQLLHPELLPLFGDLDALCPKGDGGFSPRHAALARVRYIGSEARSLIVYLKPTLTVDDPVDVREYRSKHPDFPQQSTLNQFFDEAQWESYRKLGEVIAGRVFAKPDRDPEWFSPNCLWPEFQAGGDELSAGSAGTSSSRGCRAAAP
ncbi:MAG: hypothetical protein NVS9B10_20390 [Nevskia sp.]